MNDSKEGCSRLFAGGLTTGFVIFGIMVTIAAIGAWGVEGIFLGPAIMIILFCVFIFLFG